MRLYRLTKRGRERVRTCSQVRDDLLDFLYEAKGAGGSLAELTALVGKGKVGPWLRRLIKEQLVEEVNGDF